MTATTVETGNFGHPVQTHFTADEFAARQQLVREELARRDLDGLLVSRIEDQYWLCGLDTTGYTIFHAMFIAADGALTHLSRSADLANVAYSSTCADVRLYDDVVGNTRSSNIKNLLASHGMKGKRVGIQLDSFGMLPDLYVELAATLEGWCELEPASDIITRLRLVKSDAELTYMRRAGEILGQANAAAVRATVPGAFEGDIAAEFNRVLLEQGADICAEPNWPLGAGQKSLLVRHTTGRGYVSENDQVLFEPGVAYRHYNVANMYTVLTGPKVDGRHIDMHAACVAALDSVQALIRPGNTFAQLYAEHRRVLEDFGFGHAALLACGYPMGAMWPPTWMERPMIAKNEPLVLAEGMTIFTHMILTDRAAELTMCLGETSIVTSDAPEVLAPLPRTVIVSGQAV